MSDSLKSTETEENNVFLQNEKICKILFIKVGASYSQESPVYEEFGSKML
jgi:hypothetical protein